MSLSEMVVDDNIVPNSLVTKLAECAALISVSQPTRGEAARLAGESEVILDEASLFMEWQNDVLDEWAPFMMDPDYVMSSVAAERQWWEEARVDPDRAYIEWVKSRVLNPFQITSRVVKKASRMHGQDRAITLAMSIWDQEIAWAQRLRRSEDQEVAVYAMLFIKQVAKDPSREYLKMIRVLEVAEESQEYVLAREHQMAAAQIRHGAGATAFRPLFLRLAEQENRVKVAALSPNELSQLADLAKQSEIDELAQHTRIRTLLVLQSVRFGRMTGIIHLAQRLDLTSDDVFAAEKAFQEAVRDGSVQVDVEAGIPYADFVAWLKRKGKRVKEQRGTSKARKDAVAAIAMNPGRWLMKLPMEYRQFGADLKLYSEWRTSIVSGDRPYPEDAVSDFGFFLLANDIA